VRIVSRAEDLFHTANYSVLVHRRSSDASLISLVCGVTLINSTGVLGGNFESVLREDQRVGVVLCTAKANHPSASVRYRLTVGSATSDGGAWTNVSSQSPWSTPKLILNFEANLIEFRVTSEDGNTNMYSVKLFVLLDSATLVSLHPVNASWPSLLPPFHSATINYTLVLSNNQDVLSLVAVRSHSRTNYSYSFSTVDEFNPTAAPVPILVNSLLSSSNETAPLLIPEGDSLIYIHLIAEDGNAERTYTVRVHRISSSSSLAGLSCSACGDHGTDNRPNQPAGNGSARAVGLQPSFHNATLSYSLISPAALSPLRFVVFPSRLLSVLRVELNGALIAGPLQGSSPLLINVGPMLFGNNTLLLNVRSEAGDTTTVYNVSIYRLSADAAVATCIPGVTAVQQQPMQWQPDGANHRFSFAANVSQVSLSLTPRSNVARSLDYSLDAGVHWINATRAVNAAGVPLFSIPNITLPLGSTLLRILVQAEDETLRSYTVRLHRLDSNTALVQLDCQPLMAPLSLAGINTTDPSVTQHQLSAVAPPNTPTLRCNMVAASVGATIQLCNYDNAATLPLAVPQCQFGASFNFSATTPLVNFATTLLEVRVTAEDAVHVRNFFVRVHVLSDDRWLSWLTIEIDGVARQLAPPFNPMQDEYRVFVDRDDNPNVDTMQWPSVLMAAAVQPTSNISVLNSDGSLQPLIAAATSVVNTSSVLQLRVTSEIGSTSDVRVTIHPVSRLVFRCAGSRNLSDLVPVGVPSETAMDCMVQTPSNAKPFGGSFVLLVQLFAENRRWMRNIATLTAVSGTSLWTSVPFDSPSIVAAGKKFTVEFSLSGQAAHQFTAPSNVSFALLDVPLWSMQQRGLNGTGGITGGFVAIQPSLRAGERNYSSVLGDTYDFLELGMTMQPVDDSTVFHANDAFAVRQREDDETRRQSLFANDPAQLALSRKEDPRDAQQLKAPNSTLFIRMLPGQNQLKLRWPLLGEATLLIWNGKDVVPPVAQLALYNSPQDRNVLQGSSLQLGTQLLSLDPAIRLDDLSFEWSSPSHPQLQLIGGTRPAATSSAHANRAAVTSPPAGELWVNGSLLSTGSYTFSVLVTDRHPGHRSAKDGGPVTASASLSVVVLSRRDFVALGCEFARDAITGLCLPCPQGAYCPGGQIISNKRAHRQCSMSLR
jgi:hypothetical protein